MDSRTTPAGSGSGEIILTPLFILQLSQKYVTPEKEDLKITLKGKEKEKENYYSLVDYKIKILKPNQLGLSD